MTKFTIALREIGTYKEVLRSQVEHQYVQLYITMIVLFIKYTFVCHQSLRYHNLYMANLLTLQYFILMLFRQLHGLIHPCGCIESYPCAFITEGRTNPILCITNLQLHFHHVV